VASDEAWEHYWSVEALAVCVFEEIHGFVEVCAGGAGNPVHLLEACNHPCSVGGFEEFCEFGFAAAF